MAESLCPVTELVEGFEYSIHSAPKRYKAEIEAIFPDVPQDDRSKYDLARTGDDIDTEKDYCLEKFFAFSKAVCSAMDNAGYWCDYIDPCSGLPMVHKDTTMVYNEVDALSNFLGYTCQNAGCCKIVLHPKWGSAVYPSTLFARAPLDVLQAAIEGSKDAVESFK